jgi:hypothetical protein
MQRWKHLVEINLGLVDQEPSLDDTLDELGVGGWELVAATHGPPQVRCDEYCLCL